jgi:hypothetical protein
MVAGRLRLGVCFERCEGMRRCVIETGAGGLRGRRQATGLRHGAL